VAGGPALNGCWFAEGGWLLLLLMPQPCCCRRLCSLPACYGRMLTAPLPAACPLAAVACVQGSSGKGGIGLLANLRDLLWIPLQQARPGRRARQAAGRAGGQASCHRPSLAGQRHGLQTTLPVINQVHQSVQVAGSLTLVPSLRRPAPPPAPTCSVPAAASA
jgi:hypothetical protein